MTDDTQRKVKEQMNRITSYVLTSPDVQDSLKLIYERLSLTGETAVVVQFEEDRLAFKEAELTDPNALVLTLDSSAFLQEIATDPDLLELLNTEVNHLLDTEFRSLMKTDLAAFQRLIESKPITTIDMVDPGARRGNWKHLNRPANNHPRSYRKRK